MSAASSFAAALVKAVRATLKTDSNVGPLVGSQVFDIVPGVKDTPFATIKPPWIYVGPLGAPRIEYVGYRAWRPRLRLFATTDAFDRTDAWTIIDAIDTALDERTLSLGTLFHMAEPLHAAECGDLVDPTRPRAAFIDFECVITRADPMFDNSD